LLIFISFTSCDNACTVIVIFVTPTDFAFYHIFENSKSVEVNRLLKIFCMQDNADIDGDLF